MDSAIEKRVSEFLEFYWTASWDEKIKIFKFAQKNGLNITLAGFFSPIPQWSDLSEQTFVSKDTHFDWNEDSQVKLLNELSVYSEEFAKLVEEKRFDMNNDFFGKHDAPIYYCLIRHFKPKKIIEVGAGYSTIFAGLAASKNEKTLVTAIDPNLPEERKKILPNNIKFVEENVQNVPFSLFQQLSENDILFIDSSHVSKKGSDVNFLYLQVLPILSSGVIIHIHDIFLPNDFPKHWFEEHLLFYNEQYLLNAFLIGNKDFEVLFGNSFMELKHPDLLKNMYDAKGPAEGASFCSISRL